MTKVNKTLIKAQAEILAKRQRRVNMAGVNTGAALDILDVNSIYIEMSFNDG